MTDYLNEKELDLILLDTLTSETPAITYEQYQKLYRELGWLSRRKGDKQENKGGSVL